MTLYPFESQLVVDANGDHLVLNSAAVTIFDPADSGMTTPLTLTDTNGFALPNPLQSSAQGFLPAFQASVPQVMWSGGGFSGYLNSFQGVLSEAVAAREAAQAAQISAADSESAAAASAQAAMDAAAAAAAGGGSGSGTGAPYSSAVVYSSAFTLGRPAENTAKGIYVCTGTDDQTKINAALAAVGRGRVQLIGPSFNISGSIKLLTGSWLSGEGLGTIVTATSDFNAGMVVFNDTSVHATTLSYMTLQGNGKAVQGVHYLNDATGSFGSAPSTSPDVAHHVHDLYITNCGTATYAGHGMHLQGANLRACRYNDIRILACTGVGVWNHENADSHFTNVEVGSSGKNGPAVSTSSTAPCAQGFFNGGPNHMFTACKAWYSRGDGFYNAGVRNGYANCQAQDNYGHGFRFYYGKVTAVGCHADSNGQAQGANSLGRAGFWVGSDAITLTGCTSYDRSGQAWVQQYGFQFSSGLTNSRILGCTTYGNLTASQFGTPGAGTTVDIAADAGGK